MNDPRASVIVVSHSRATLLRRAALSIYFQTHRDFELIIVADAAGISAVKTLPFADRIKCVLYENQNISAARNLGIDCAAGAYIAFLDDDAVAEPRWLSRLISEVETHGFGAVTGTVLGRNGLSVQWGDQSVDHRGFDAPMQKGNIRKLHGTNMLFRAEILRTLGGFDEAFHFLYDDTDAAMRLQAAGDGIGFVDMPLIHHGFAPSPRRSARRAPTTLFEIGASYTQFLNRHCPDHQHDAAMLEFEKAQMRRLSRFVLRGDLSPLRVAPLLKELRSGFLTGQTRAPALRARFDTPPAFQPLRLDSGQPPTLLSGRWWARRALRQRAAAAAMAGRATSLFLFHPTILPHQVRFHPDGYWEQVGGLFGPSDRNQAWFTPWSYANRFAIEWENIAARRG
ncbi:glycosyltransferase [Rhodobacteraceae bacterium XHP0102]|nr:glycosyltransferase [Rhodobacteraceae bacterium XHP0102]